MTKPDKNGQKRTERTETDRNGQKRNKTDRNQKKPKETDRKGQKQTDTDRNEQNTDMVLDQKSPVHTVLESRTEQDNTASF